jgi:hypothetical protein
MSRETGKKAASKASEVLRNPNASSSAKSAAGSALTQRKAIKEETSSTAATKASETLRNPNASSAAKSAAASALSQRAKGK